MKRLFRLITTTAPEANWITFTAIALLAPKLIWWNRLPPIFDGAQEIGFAWEAILVSIIASYIFYFFVVHLKEFNDKEVLRPAIHRRLQRVHGRCALQLNEISKATNIAFNFDNVSKSQIEAAFVKINPNDDAPMVIGTEGRHLNWPEYFFNFVQETKQVISKIIEHPRYLEAALVRTLVDIENSHHFAFTESMLPYARNGIRNSDLGVFADNFWSYTDLCRTIKIIDEKYYS